jgi:serine/threonine protein kinase
MAYIEGPDLEELLKPPHDPVYSVKEVIKVAEQLSNALLHCHKLDVRHGDIKSNNVKYNLHTGNYVLLDFGLAIMSDEQRRTSLRRAGAVEFMAPEQNEGLMLFQTDIYSFGVVIFELLAGRVPFPLEDKGETARNNVRLSHIETLPPDVMVLRRKNLQANWSTDKKEREMSVPDWLITLIYKCLEKNPGDRFINGIELHEFIVHNSIHAGPAIDAVQSAAFQEESGRLQKESDQLQRQLLQYKDQLSIRDKELNELRFLLKRRENELQSVGTNETAGGSKGVSRTAFLALLLLTIGLAAFSAYSLIKNNGLLKKGFTTDSAAATATIDTDNTVLQNPVKTSSQRKKDSLSHIKHITDSVKKVNKKRLLQVDSSIIKDTNNNRGDDNIDISSDQADPATTAPNKFGRYKAASTAYFYNEPDEDTRRDGVFINKWNAPVNASDDMNGFIYVVYTNEKKQTTRGWLLKKDLVQVK